MLPWSTGAELTWSKDEKGQERGGEDDLSTTSIEVLCKCRQEKTKIVPKTRAMVDLKMFWVSNRVLGIKSRPFHTTCSCSRITCTACIHRLIDFTQSNHVTKSINTHPKPSYKKRFDQIVTASQKVEKEAPGDLYLRAMFSMPPTLSPPKKTCRTAQVGWGHMFECESCLWSRFNFCLWYCLCVIPGHFWGNKVVN